ncbi:MAG: aldolase/citrate lyase family protein [Pseudomonadota bacterium]|nr:aldolase/citrate lyase family protein [Pseudomonadota bacterium]
MPVVRNIAKQRLAEGRLVLGLGLRQARTVDIGMIARSCGFDYLFLDCEHNAMDLGVAADISVAALGQGVTPIVRVPGKEPFHSVRVLDNGAQGVVVPHVDSAEEARAIAANLRYPPAGHRSISRASPLVGFDTVPLEDFMREANDETLVVVMLESPAAITQAGAIAAVPGIDVLLIGTNDLCAEMGIHGQFGHERVAEAYAEMIRACRVHGKHAGMAGVREDELMQRYIGMGARFILAGVDLPLMMEAGKARTKFLRGVEAGL